MIFPTRTALQIERYLNYRLFGYRHSCIDHGILGGLSFFNLIIENYIKEYKENKEIYNRLDFTDFSVTNLTNSPLRLTIEQTLLFAYISDCIINHNIWKCPKDCERLYRKYGLDALIGYRFKKIDFYKNPLLFLLVIADTLEPYKNYCNAYYGHTIDEQSYDESEAIAILKDYNLEVTDSRIIITVPDNYIGVCEEKLKDMQDWISIEYTKQLNKFYIRPVMTY